MVKDEAYYNSLDKRTKEYKDYTKGYKKESEGLGDTLEKVFEKTGIKKVVEWMSDGKDCGCDKRKAILNEKFRYNPECLVKSEYDYLIEYNKRHNPKSFSGEDVRKLLNIHHRVLRKRPKVCVNCNSGVRVMNEVVDNLNKLLEEYEG